MIQRSCSIIFFGEKGVVVRLKKQPGKMPKAQCFGRVCSEISRARFGRVVIMDSSGLVEMTGMLTG